MRSIHRGEFIVDIGRKELYNRISKVDAVWGELLGKDYRDYPHRGGILYQGRIIDMSPAYQGFRRGMPWGMFVKCSFDFLRACLFSGTQKPRNVEEYFYQNRGRELTRIFSQGFQEKLTGRKWADIEVSDAHLKSVQSEAGLLSTLKDIVVRTFSKKEVNTYRGIWRHPAKGTGQICESMAAEITAKGGRIDYEAQILDITTAGGRINSVVAEVKGERIQYEPDNVVSSIPLEFLMRFLTPQVLQAKRDKVTALDPLRKTVVLVYLFLSEEPRFPQAWLQVTCPTTRIGRITNYSGFNGDMVPKGKTCLCCEFYCFGADPLLEKTNDEIADLAIKDCALPGLATPSACFDRLVLRLPGADASQNRDNWMSKARLGLLDELKPFVNLYYVNRTETDIATLAGIEAAEAILSGNRVEFDRHVDPGELNIRSEGKAFEFKLPTPNGLELRQQTQS